MKKKIIIGLVILLVVAIGVAGYILFNKSEVKKLTPDEQRLQDVMAIVKTDKDYSDFVVAVKNFDPELTNYQKLGPEEYKTVKAEWEKNNLGERAKLLDSLVLNDSTYLVELQNKNDKNKSLIGVIDIKENKSLLIFAAITVNVRM